MPLNQRDTVRQGYGQAWLDTLSLALRNPEAVLWVDDLFSGNLATRLGTDRFWTSLLFDRLEEEKRMSTERRVESTLRFMEFGFDFLGPSPAAVVRAVEASDWEVGRSPLAEVLNWLGNPRTDSQVLRLLVIESLARLWRQKREASTLMMRQITFAILDSLRPRPDLSSVLAGLEKALLSRFWVDPIQGDRLRKALSAWTGSRLQLPRSGSGLLYLPR